MRVLLTQIMDAPRAGSWRGDSCYLSSLYMYRAAVERGWFVYWVLPDLYEPPDLGRTKFIRYGMEESPRSNRHQHYKVMKAVESEFKSATDHKFVDIVFCNDCYLAMMLREWFGAVRFWVPPPVVHWNGYPTIREWSETNWEVNGDGFPLHLRALALASTDWISCCPYCTGRHTELVRTYCSPEMVRRFVETRSEQMMGPDCELLDSIETGKFERFSMYWGGRFTNTKGGEKSVEQYLKFVMAGRDADIHVTAVGGAGRLAAVLKKLGAKDLVKVYQNLPYMDAMRIMKRCHAACFYQLNPGAAAPYEWMYGGVIVLFKRHHFPEEELMYPPGYPFLFENDEECAAYLRWIYEEYETAWGAFEACGARQWVREKMDKMTAAHRMWDIASSKIARPVSENYKWREETLELVGRVLEGMEEPVRFPELLEAIDRVKGRAVIQRGWGSGVTGILPVMIYREFIPQGWVDDCLGEIPAFVRRG
jgi:hypothetical protein